MARLAMAVALLALGLCAWAAGDDEEYAYLTGVYWFDGELYHVDVTCWNVPGNPEGGLVEGFKTTHGGSYAEGGPDGWYWWVDPYNLRAFAPDDEYMIPPGESLGGFRFAADFDPGQVVSEYYIGANEGPGTWGWFTPEYIPEPWLAGPLALAAPFVAGAQLAPPQPTLCEMPISGIMESVGFVEWSRDRLQRMVNSAHVLQ
jgi:hypothetical protein